MSYAPPMFEAGQVIDLRYRRVRDGIKLPDRIYIDMVYRKKDSKTWMYHVLSEQANGYTYMTQDKIFTNTSEHATKCYERPEVQKLMKLGYRFITNTDNCVMESITMQLDKIDEIAEIIASNTAIDRDGNNIDGTAKGIWIKYKTVIPMQYDDIGLEFSRIK